MISIIICSVDTVLLEKITTNISQTIGVPYEIIAVDNRENKYNIFQAYNVGFAKAKFPYACFTHEDILFHTKDWGKKVINHLENEEIGLIGICGATSMPACPAPWWSNETLNTHVVNNINNYKNGERVWHDERNPFNENATEVAVIDGVWFCLRTEFMKTLRFDDETFNHFHAYDSDISLQVLSKGKKVKVVFDILMEHRFAPEKGSKFWVEAVHQLAQKWKGFLPVFTHQVNTQHISLYHYRALLYYAYTMQSHKYAEQEIKQRINMYFPLVPFELKSREALLLYLWKTFGYTFSRFLYFPLKYLFKNEQ